MVAYGGHIIQGNHYRASGSNHESIAHIRNFIVLHKTSDGSFEAVSYKRLVSVVTPNRNTIAAGISNDWLVFSGESNGPAVTG